MSNREISLKTKEKKARLLCNVKPTYMTLKPRQKKKNENLKKESKNLK